MRGSWQLGTLAGIRVRVHWSFLILPLLIGWSAWSTAGPAAAVGAVLFVLALFGCVVLHELGHALAARRYGIGTRDITLLPIGGVARLERMPRASLQELVIALAGPAVNVVIAAAIAAGLWLQGGSLATVLGGDLLHGSFLVRLMWANVALVLFNLLPAFPMDGGRVLRAALSMRLSHTRATEIAAGIGQAMAIAFAAFGLYFGGWTLVLVAAFVYFAGRGEVAMARLESATAGMYVSDLMQQQFQTISASARVADIAPQLPFTSQQDFPVVRGRELVGMVSAGDVIASMAAGDGGREVASLMQPGVAPIDRRATLLETFSRMPPGTSGSLPVADGGVLVGILPQERLRRWLQTVTSTKADPPLAIREGR